MGVCQEEGEGSLDGAMSHCAERVRLVPWEVSRKIPSISSASSSISLASSTASSGKRNANTVLPS